MMRPSNALAVITLIVILSVQPFTASAQDTKLEVRSGDSVKTVLDRQVGKRVGLVLNTGAELAGVVTAVGDHVVHLSELTGREFFDAVVTIDRISAVVIRVRSR